MERTREGISTAVRDVTIDGMIDGLLEDKKITEEEGNALWKVYKDEGKKPFKVAYREAQQKETLTEMSEDLEKEKATTETAVSSGNILNEYQGIIDAADGEIHVFPSKTLLTAQSTVIAIKKKLERGGFTDFQGPSLSEFSAVNGDTLVSVKAKGGNVEIGRAHV